MKKYLLLSLILAMVNHWLAAQRQPEFQYTLYVEDGRGKKDSVMLGYDRTESRLTLNPLFGEVDIKSTPFDSTFEVRATEASNRFNIQFHSKKIITFFEGDCNYIAVSSNITLLIRAKYYPLKFSWAKSPFDASCRGKSILVSSENYYTLDPTLRRSNDSVFGTSYMRDTSMKIERFSSRNPSGGPNSFLHYTFLAPTNAGGNDTIWTYAMSFRSESANIIIDTKESAVKQMKSYPNPCSDLLNLEFSDYETGKVNILDLAGRHIKSIHVESANQLKIDVHDFNTGMYFLNFRAASGKTYVSKFVKP